MHIEMKIFPTLKCIRSKLTAQKIEFGNQQNVLKCTSFTRKNPMDALCKQINIYKNKGFVELQFIGSRLVHTYDISCSLQTPDTSNKTSSYKVFRTPEQLKKRRRHKIIRSQAHD